MEVITPKPKVYFKADVSARIGLGHLIRCLALAEIIESSFDCCFLISSDSLLIISIIQPKFGHLVIEAESPDQEIIQLRRLVEAGSIMVLDGYGFDINYQKAVREFIKKLVVIDDKSGAPFYADVIINHGDIAVLPKYDVPSFAKLYTGFEYLILRKCFLEYLPGFRNNPSHTVFVCAGGADPFNVTTKMLRAIACVDGVSGIIVVTGALFTFRDELSKTIALIGQRISVKHYENISGEKMISLLELSDWAISTASTISLEICCTKTPLACGTVIENQQAIYSALVKSGCCLPLGKLNYISDEELSGQISKLLEPVVSGKIALNQSETFNGNSSIRITELFKTLWEA